MKKYLECLAMLQDPDSSAFLGSAISLSFYQLLFNLDEEMAEDFLSLFQADLELYKEEVVKGNCLKDDEIKKYLSYYPICFNSLKFVLSLPLEEHINKIVFIGDNMLHSLFNLTKSVLLKKREIDFNYQENDNFIKNKRRYLLVLNSNLIYHIAEPIIILSKKLLERKQKGKNPFSDSLSVSRVCVLLDKIKEAKEVKSEECYYLSLSFSSFIGEIKTPSLKEDYRYLSQFYHFFGCVIDTID